MTDTPVEELHPCMGICCCFCSFFCGFPSCIGCNCSETWCCYQYKYVCCKLMDCSDEDSRCCTLCQGGSYLNAPNKCYEGTCQLCCVDYRAAFPCTKKVPCLWAFLGIQCCADWKCVGPKCCNRLGDLVPRLDERAGKSSTSEK